MRKAIMAIAAALVGVVVLGISGASAQQFRCGYNVRCPQPQVMQQQRIVTQRRIVSWRTVTVRRPVYQRSTVVVSVPVVQQAEAPCLAAVQQSTCNTCGQQVARVNFATAPVSPATIGQPTGNSCDKSNPQPYQRDGKWFICR